MTMSKANRLLRVAAAAALAALSFAPGAHAQGCILCYTSVAAGSPAALHAFKLGMLTLLIPALALFAAVFLLILYRVRTAAAEAV